MSESLLELDGSFGEGGGQILRTSLALSLLTGKGFHLKHVRAKRSKPGLQPQHLMSVRAAATIGQAQTRGASVGSTDLVFEPGALRPGPYRFDIGTAGATGLVLHTIYLPLMLGTGSPCEVTLVGGTHVTASPCFHFLDVTWRAYLGLLGLRMKLEMERPGFYPRGGGLVRAVLQPAARVEPLTLTTHKPGAIVGISAVAGLPETIAKRQARRAAYLLEKQDIEVTFREESWQGGPGTFVGLIEQTRPAPTLFFGLGARGKPAEVVAEEAVEQLLGYHFADPEYAVDAHSADQLALPLALAEGKSEYTVTEVTLHLTTNLAVIRKFLERELICEGEIGKPGRVRIE